MRAAVLGSPIAHSLSPVLHNAGYVALGLSDWEYGRFELQADELSGFLAGLGPEWRGLSLTMPLKEACLKVAAEVSPLAALAGAGNTLVRLDGGGWRADNTDVGGLVDVLRPSWDSSWASAAVLGSGATARSALLALAELGATEVTGYARNAQKASSLTEWAAIATPALTVRAGRLADWPIADEPAVLSTLPGGAADGFSIPRPRPGLLFDVVYAGWPTPLARAAAAAGMIVVGGLDMLVRQAARQFELFTGHTAPIDAMFAAGRAVLNTAPSSGTLNPTPSSRRTPGSPDSEASS